MSNETALLDWRHTIRICDTICPHGKDLMGVGCRECEEARYHLLAIPSRGTTAGELTRMHVESENPDHYKRGPVECINALRSMMTTAEFAAYCRGQIVRYVWRMGQKDESTIEAKKAQVYCRWLVETLEGKELSK